MDFQEAMIQLQVDEKTLLNRFSGNRALMERFIRKFLQDKTYAELCEANRTGDADGMLRAAHTLKGISGNLGMDALYRLCSQMVEDLRAGRLEHIEERFTSIRQEYERIIRCLALLD
ncbi:Hpt domain-containing protein [Clostridium sp. D33t1_170424_F3]|uniref:Hpt domain-containing protein n=1 Tax=Clostridium sp. D33t1_170424_F3 TaxID=2787099 RepID=UPI0018A8C0A5|nr:Hpt domain-containing protein [Clostridium sp. D33t1_170424_F3]